MKKICEIIRHEIAVGGKGGLALMARHQQGDSFITLATSVCSADDQYSKKIALQYLRISFVEGRVIKVPLYQGFNKNTLNHAQLRSQVTDIVDGFLR